MHTKFSLSSFLCRVRVYRNSIYGSAVCSYSLADIEAGFEGPLTGMEDGWQRMKPASPWYRCKYDKPLDGDALLEVKRRHQVFSPISAATVAPLYNSERERLTHVQVDEVRTANHDTVHVIFFTTLEGVLKKMAYHPSTGKSCVVEQLHVFRDGEVANRLQLVKKMHAIYAATSFGVVKIPLSFCGRFETSQDCLAAGDPYCGWDSEEEACTTAPEDLDSTWEQAPICVHREGPVNGAWGAWNPWKGCGVENGAPTDACVCRDRKCDSPAPSNGGLRCVGTDVSVLQNRTTRFTLRGEGGRGGASRCGKSRNWKC